MMNVKKGFISGSTLKLIALVSMLIDHTTAVILGGMLYRAPAGNFSFISQNPQKWQDIYMGLRGVGRLAFPIFCFLLVEGFQHTKNVKKYMGRLLAFAFISELPFDFALQQRFFDWQHCNVYFTLFLGLLAIAGIEYSINWYQRKLEEGGNAGLLLLCRSLMIILFAFGTMGVAEFLLQTDYGLGGVAAIIVIYEFRQRPVLSFLVGVLVLGLCCGSIELYAALGAILIYFYNGKRGLSLKYLFYWFYPVHLLILGVVGTILGIGVAL